MLYLSKIKFIDNMKIVVILIFVAAFIAASCSQYTCPTYSKGTANKVVKETNI